MCFVFSLFYCCVFVLICLCKFGVLQHHRPHYSVNLCVCVFIVLTHVHCYSLLCCCVFALICMCVFGVLQHHGSHYLVNFCVCFFIVLTCVHCYPCFSVVYSHLFVCVCLVFFNTMDLDNNWEINLHFLYFKKQIS